MNCGTIANREESNNKITQSDLEDIRNLRLLGFSKRDLAIIYNLSAEKIVQATENHKGKNGNQASS